MNTTLTIGLAQMQVIKSDPQANLNKAEAFIKDAAQKGVQLLCFPELFTTGFSWAKNKELVKDADTVIKALSEMARRYKIWINGSVLTKTATEKPANTSILFDDTGKEVARYSKTHLFTLTHEDRHMTPGDKLCTVETPWGRIGLAICYDLRFPELFRSYALQGIQLVLLPMAFPLQRMEHMKVLLRARAIEDQFFVSGINQVAHQKLAEDDPAKFCGTSAVIGPWGEPLIEGSTDTEELLVTTIDFSKADEAREKMTVLKDRRPELYTLS